MRANEIAVFTDQNERSTAPSPAEMMGSVRCRLGSGAHANTDRESSDN